MAPGGAAGLRRRTLPGLTRKVERSTTGRSSGVSLPLDLHIARRARRRGGRCPFRPDDRQAGPAAVRLAPTGHPAATAAPTAATGKPGLRPRSRSPVCQANPAPLPLDAIHRQSRRRCRPGSFGRLPDLRPRSSRTRSAGRTRLRCPFDAVHADPVARAIAGVAVLRSPEQLGCSFDLRSVRTSTSHHRQAGGSSWRLVASRPYRTRFRIVSRVRFPPRSTRRSVSKDSVSRPRCACAPRYGAHLRGHETAGQEVILNPQGYPPNFSLFPRNARIVHRPFTSRAQRCPQVAAVDPAVGLTFGVRVA